MAAGTEAKIATLLFLFAVMLLAHTLLLRPPGVVTDCLLSALDLRLVELVNRRNIVLLCNVILLLILVDAGLLAAPARRHGANDAATSAVAGGAAVDRSLVLSTRSSAAGESAIVTTVSRVKRERRVREPEASSTARARARRRLPLSRSSPKEDSAAAELREIDLLEEQQSAARCSQLDLPVSADETAVLEDGKSKSASCHFELIAGSDERSRGEEGAEPEYANDDVDELNKRFEWFIASMRRRMQLESMQLVKV